jgi:pilus assembly protein CpaF
MPTPTLDLILPHLPHPLQEAILSNHYSEICVCENGLVFAEVAGRNSMEQLSVGIPTQDQLRKAVNAIARLISRREANDQKPILEARLPDGSRVAAMMPPIVQGITLTVRKFARTGSRSTNWLKARRCRQPRPNFYSSLSGSAPTY